MRKLLLFVLCATLFVALSANASTIINFDDLVGDNILVPDGYAGVTWHGEWTYYGFTQFPYTPSSPPNRVYDFLTDASFDFSSPVVFDGAWFSGNAFATVQFQGYLGGVLQFTSGTLAPTDVPAFLASGYGGAVDSIHVLSPSPDFFVMDDVTYQSAVPEPGSILLLGSGLLGMAGVLRRKLML